MMTAKKQKQNAAITSQEEKDALLASLKTTMHDLGRLPGLIFAPVIGYVSAHYAKIPEERKSHLKNILDEIKAGGSESVGKLKDWFKGVIAPQPATGKDKKSTSGSTKKTTPKKETSRTDKLKNATNSVADKAKETTKKATDAAKETTKKATAKTTTTKKPAPKKAAPKTTTTKKPAPKKAAPKTTTTKKPAPKTTTTKKPAPKKAAPKTTTTKKPAPKQ